MTEHVAFDCHGAVDITKPGKVALTCNGVRMSLSHGDSLAIGLLISIEDRSPVKPGTLILTFLSEQEATELLREEETQEPSEPWREVESQIRRRTSQLGVFALTIEYLKLCVAWPLLKILQALEALVEHLLPQEIRSELSSRRSPRSRQASKEEV